MKTIILSVILLSFNIVVSAQDHTVIDSLEKVLHTDIHDTVRVGILAQLSHTYSYSDIDKSLVYAEKSLKLAKKLKDDGEIIQAYVSIADVYERKNYGLDTVLSPLNDALNLATDKNLKEEKTYVLNRIGTAYLKFGHRDTAFSLLQQSLEIAEKFGLKKVAVLSLINTAVLLGYDGNTEKEKTYYERALIYSKELNLETNIAIIYSNLGLIHSTNNQLDSALIFYNKALEIKEKYGNKSGAATTLSSIGRIYTLKGDYKKADNYLKIGYNLAKEINDNNALAVNLSYLGLNAQTQNKHKEALQYLKEELEVLGKNGYARLKVKCYEAISISYEAIGNYKDALQYERSYRTLNDSIYNLEKDELIQNLEIKYDTEKKEAENNLLKANLKSRQYILIGLGLALLFSVVLIFLIYRNNRTKQTYNKILQQKNEELQQLDETKTRFFTNISHEFKTPLTLIINPIRKVLSRNKLSEEDKFLIQSAEKNSLQLFDLTKQILELTKFEVNKGNYNPINFNLYKALKKTYADFESAAISRNIDFQLEFSGDEDLVVYSDYFKFSTVLKNLISNALKFTSENGKVVIEGIVENQNVILKVTDNGQGIHHADLPYVFDRYYQAKHAARIQEGGTGIGLAICNEFVKMMNGQITVNSQYGQGSEFIVQIPIVTNSAASATLFEMSENKTTLPQPTLKNSQFANILLVEDNSDMQEYIRFILQNNYNIHIVSHGKAALDFLNKNDNIQLIISDLMMPEMNGHELVTALKKHPKFSNIPTIMLTALSGMEDKLKALRIGIDDYLTKPFVDEELMARIDNLIEYAEERKNYQNIISEQTNDSSNYTNEDQIWLEKLEQTVKDNINNHLMSIEFIAEQFFIGQSTLYKKIKRLTGLTPKQYINEIKFQAARQIIEQGNNHTVKAIAFEVGFKDEKYFSRQFKKRFGKYPSEHLE